MKKLIIFFIVLFGYTWYEMTSIRGSIMIRGRGFYKKYTEIHPFKKFCISNRNHPMCLRSYRSISRERFQKASFEIYKKMRYKSDGDVDTWSGLDANNSGDCEDLCISIVQKIGFQPTNSKMFLGFVVSKSGEISGHVWLVLLDKHTNKLVLFDTFGRFVEFKSRFVFAPVSTGDNIYLPLASYHPNQGEKWIPENKLEEVLKEYAKIAEKVLEGG